MARTYENPSDQNSILPVKNTSLILSISEPDLSRSDSGFFEGSSEESFSRVPSSVSLVADITVTLRSQENSSESIDEEMTYRSNFNNSTAPGRYKIELELKPGVELEEWVNNKWTPLSLPLRTAPDFDPSPLEKEIFRSLTYHRYETTFDARKIRIKNAGLSIIIETLRQCIESLKEQLKTEAKKKNIDIDDSTIHALVEKLDGVTPFDLHQLHPEIFKSVHREALFGYSIRRPCEYSDPISRDAYVRDMLLASYLWGKNPLPLEEPASSPTPKLSLLKKIGLYLKLCWLNFINKYFFRKSPEKAAASLAPIHETSPREPSPKEIYKNLQFSWAIENSAEAMLIHLNRSISPQ